MTDKKIRLKEQNQDGTYDYLFPATKSSIVDVNGKTLDTVLAETDGKITENNDSFILQLSKKQNYLSNPVRRITDNFIDFENWISKTALGDKQGDWLFENNSIKANIDSGVDAHFAWHKDSIQDGKISFIWENPKRSTTELISTAILFRAKDYKNYFAAFLYSGGTAENKVILYKVTNGTSYATLSSVSLTGDDVKIIDNVPIYFEVNFYGNIANVIINGKKVITHSIEREFNSGKFGIHIPATNTAISNLETKITNFSSEEKKYDNVYSGVTEILFAGDSIANNEGATDGNGWVELLDKELIKTNPNLNITNISINGANSLAVYNAIATELNANPNKYDMVIVSCGTNNTRIEVSVRRTLEQTLLDFTSMVKIIKNVGATPIICTPPNYKEDTYVSLPSNYGPDSFDLLKRIASGIRLVADTENIRLVDNYTVLNNDWSKLSSDGVHPIDPGHYVLYLNALNTIFNRKPLVN